MQALVPAAVKGGRQGGVEQRGDDAPHLLQKALVLHVRCSVLRRELCDRGECALLVTAHHQVPTRLLRRRERRGVPHEILETELLEFKLLDDAGTQQAREVRRARELETGDQLLRHGGAADNVPALEHQNTLPVLCEVSGSDKAVVATADDDDVVARACRGSKGQGRPLVPGQSVTLIKRNKHHALGGDPLLHFGGRDARDVCLGGVLGGDGCAYDGCLRSWRWYRRTCVVNK